MSLADVSLSDNACRYFASCHLLIFQIPSTIEAEKSYNPFLRTRESDLLGSLKIAVDSAGFVSDKVRAEGLAECRARKDAFKYRS
jgi:Hydroxyacylglutathione hydrolase C-terminus